VSQNPFDQYDDEPQAIPLAPADPKVALGIQGERLGVQRDAATVPYAGPKAAADLTGSRLGNRRTAQDIHADRIKLMVDLRSKFEALPAVKDYRAALPQLASAMQAPDTAQGDLAVIYAFAKAMDPGSAVRGEEMDMAQSSSPLIGQLQTMIGRVNSGKRLPPDTRKGLVEAIRTKTIQFNRAYKGARQQYGDLAKEAGFDPQQILGEHDGTAFHEIEKQYLGKSQVTSGKVAESVDAKKSATLDALIRRGASFKEASQWARENGSTINPGQYAAAVAFAKENPGHKGSLAEFIVQKETTPVQQVLGSLVGPADMGLVKGGIQAWDRAAQGLESAANLIPGIDSSSAQQSAQEHQDFFAGKVADPTFETIGRLGASTAIAAPLTSPMAAGAAGNLLMTDSTGLEAAGDAAMGAVGGKAADMILRGLSGTVAPAGRDALQRLSSEGYRATPGQIIGPRAKNLEDRLTANPVLGPKIDALRQQGLEQFNRIPANRALGHIGETLPPNVPAGHEAVAYTQQRLGNAYDQALSGAQIGLDPTYVTRLNAIGQGSRLRPQEFNQFGDIVQQELGGAFQVGNNPVGTMTGKDFKKIDSRLGQLVGDLGKSPDIYQRDIAEALGQVRDQTKALARRQNPGLRQKLNAADEGWADFAILRRAAQSNPATGIATPGQLRTAVKAGDKSVGKGATARGEARMQDLAKDGTEVIPSDMGSSGTSEREQVNKIAPWILGTLLDPLYSPPVVSGLEKLLLRKPGPAAKKVAKAFEFPQLRTLGGIGIPAFINPGSGY
jgi:hypothetical protein